MKKLLFILLTITTVHASELKLKGTALLEYSIFGIDIYQISYYSDENDHQEMLLEYKRDVAKKYSIEGWNVGLKSELDRSPTSEKKIQWILDHTKNVKEGDKFLIKKVKDQVSFWLNGKKIAQTRDSYLSNIIFSPWIGPNPIDQDLKQKLLGNKES